MSIGIAYNPCKNCKEMDKCSICELTYYRKGYIKSPTADVIEVVRCKDCVHWEHEGTDFLTKRPFGSCKCKYWEHPTEYFSMLDNDYCSYGERREDDDT